MSTEGGEQDPEDIVAFAARVYDRAMDLAPTFDELVHAALTGVRRHLVKGGPYPLLEVKVRDGAIAPVWRGGVGETVLIPKRIVRSRTIEGLRFLERLGHAVLRSDAHFPPNTLHLTPADYERWAVGDTVPLEEWKPLPTDRRAQRTSCISPLLEWFECQRRAAGAVGWYWCLPMLYLVTLSHGPPRPWSPRLALVRRSVACPPAPRDMGDGAAVVVPLLENLCPGLPAGCAVRFRHWCVGEWRAHAPLVQHLGRTVCFSLPGLAWGARERVCPRRREDRYFPVDEEDDDLVVCVVAGRLPLALAGFHSLPVHPNHHYVTALCALTGGRGGSLLVDWLKRWVSRVPKGRLLLDADRSVATFYEQHGFGPSSDRNDGEFRWPPRTRRSVKRARSATAGD